MKAAYSGQFMAHVRKSPSTGDPGSVEFRPYGYFYHSRARQPQWTDGRDPGNRLSYMAGTLTVMSLPSPVCRRQRPGARRLPEDVMGETNPDQVSLGWWTAPSGSRAGPGIFN